MTYYVQERQTVLLDTRTEDSWIWTLMKDLQ